MFKDGNKSPIHSHHFTNCFCINLSSVWCPRKGHTYLNKPPAESRFDTGEILTSEITQNVLHMNKLEKNLQNNQLEFLLPYIS